MENMENIGALSENQMFLQTQLMNIENNTMLANKTVQQLEDENDKIKEQIMKNKEKLKSKVEMSNQFKQLVVAFNQRFAQYEKRNNYLQQYINQLEEKLKKREIELNESLKDKNKIK